MYINYFWKECSGHHLDKWTKCSGFFIECFQGSTEEEVTKSGSWLINLLPIIVTKTFTKCILQIGFSIKMFPHNLFVGSPGTSEGGF